MLGQLVSGGPNARYNGLERCIRLVDLWESIQFGRTASCRLQSVHQDFGECLSRSSFNSLVIFLSVTLVGSSVISSTQGP